uniref:Uncharacterized protein n=1 Tax=Chromera velia CCMP2878 TaxID=1169474 RepID=A0A0G4HP03_9ALVE|eukprot:Cvel_1218.t1-p1 / transcript=Cvel_1218.t1 / gene=Cvel_1218 / organism=Chromera_velia_CCMP2878 / gene_product=hypothetical protein / transcript_product=hypothetical protein / location=Cvel_scaffold40:138884-144506(-) / protein_length=1418 / sequence_SO=supercontig / SO=protein_coding / is_pseudo=false
MPIVVIDGKVYANFQPEEWLQTVWRPYIAKLDLERHRQMQESQAFQQQQEPPPIVQSQSHPPGGFTSSASFDGFLTHQGAPPPRQPSSTAPAQQPQAGALGWGLGQRGPPTHKDASSSGAATHAEPLVILYPPQFLRDAQTGALLQANAPPPEKTSETAQANSMQEQQQKTGSRKSSKAAVEAETQTPFLIRTGSSVRSDKGSRGSGQLAKKGNSVEVQTVQTAPIDEPPPPTSPPQNSVPVACGSPLCQPRQQHQRSSWEHTQTFCGDSCLEGQPIPEIRPEGSCGTVPRLAGGLSSPDRRRIETVGYTDSSANMNMLQSVETSPFGTSWDSPDPPPVHTVSVAAGISPLPMDERARPKFIPAASRVSGNSLQNGLRTTPNSRALYGSSADAGRASSRGAAMSAGGIFPPPTSRQQQAYSGGGNRTSSPPHRGGTSSGGSPTSLRKPINLFGAFVEMPVPELRQPAERYGGGSRHLPPLTSHRASGSREGLLVMQGNSGGPHLSPGRQRERNGTWVSASSLQHHQQNAALMARSFSAEGPINKPGTGQCSMPRLTGCSQGNDCLPPLSRQGATNLMRGGMRHPHPHNDPDENFATDHAFAAAAHAKSSNVMASLCEDSEEFVRSVHRVSPGCCRPCSPIPACRHPPPLPPPTCGACGVSTSPCGASPASPRALPCVRRPDMSSPTRTAERGRQEIVVPEDRLCVRHCAERSELCSHCCPSLLCAPPPCSSSCSPPPCCHHPCAFPKPKAESCGGGGNERRAPPSMCTCARRGRSPSGERQRERERERGGSIQKGGGTEEDGGHHRRVGDAQSGSVSAGHTQADMEKGGMKEEEKEAEDIEESPQEGAPEEGSVERFQGRRGSLNKSGSSIRSRLSQASQALSRQSPPHLDPQPQRASKRQSAQPEPCPPVTHAASAAPCCMKCPTCSPSGCGCACVDCSTGLCITETEARVLGAAEEAERDEERGFRGTFAANLQDAMRYGRGIPLPEGAVCVPGPVPVIRQGGGDPCGGVTVPGPCVTRCLDPGSPCQPAFSLPECNGRYSVKVPRCAGEESCSPATMRTVFPCAQARGEASTGKDNGKVWKEVGDLLRSVGEQLSGTEPQTVAAGEARSRRSSGDKQRQRQGSGASSLGADRRSRKKSQPEIIETVDEHSSQRPTNCIMTASGVPTPRSGVSGGGIHAVSNHRHSSVIKGCAATAAEDVLGRAMLEIAGLFDHMAATEAKPKKKQTHKDPRHSTEKRGNGPSVPSAAVHKKSSRDPAPLQGSVRGDVTPPQALPAPAREKGGDHRGSTSRRSSRSRVIGASPLQVSPELNSNSVTTSQRTETAGHKEKEGDERGREKERERGGGQISSDPEPRSVGPSRLADPNDNEEDDGALGESDLDMDGDAAMLSRLALEKSAELLGGAGTPLRGETDREDL